MLKFWNCILGFQFVFLAFPKFWDLIVKVTSSCLLWVYRHFKSLLETSVWKVLNEFPSRIEVSCDTGGDPFLTLCGAPADGINSMLFCSNTSRTALQ